MLRIIAFWLAIESAVVIHEAITTKCLGEIQGGYVMAKGYCFFTLMDISYSVGENL